MSKGKYISKAKQFNRSLPVVALEESLMWGHIQNLRKGLSLRTCDHQVGRV